MNHRDLDRWITGNGGEDQYPKCRKCGGDVVSVPGSVGVCEQCHETHRNVLPLGWECPKCGRAYSPSIKTCQPCCMQEATDDDGC